MIKAEERYLLLQAGFTERQINTQMQKFYNLFRVAPMPQMQKNWVGLTDEEIAEGIINSWVIGQAFESAVWWAEAKLKEKNSD